MTLGGGAEELAAAGLVDLSLSNTCWSACSEETHCAMCLCVNIVFVYVAHLC